MQTLTLPPEWRTYYRAQLIEANASRDLAYRDGTLSILLERVGVAEPDDLYRQHLNIAANERQKLRRRADLLARYGQDLHPKPARNPMDEAAIWESVGEIKRRLSPTDWRILRALAHDDPLSTVASGLGFTEGGLKSRVSRTCQRLRDNLPRY